MTEAEHMAKMAELARRTANILNDVANAPDPLTDAQWRAVVRVLANYYAGLSVGEITTQEEVVQQLRDVTGWS